LCQAVSNSHYKNRLFESPPLAGFQKNDFGVYSAFGTVNTKIVFIMRIAVKLYFLSNTKAQVGIANLCFQNPNKGGAKRRLYLGFTNLHCYSNSQWLSHFAFCY